MALIPWRFRNKRNPDELVRITILVRKSFALALRDYVMSVSQRRKVRGYKRTAVSQGVAVETLSLLASKKLRETHTDVMRRTGSMHGKTSGPNSSTSTAQ